jgi:hypothetical protein
VETFYSVIVAALALGIQIFILNAATSRRVDKVEAKLDVLINLLSELSSDGCRIIPFERLLDRRKIYSRNYHNGTKENRRRGKKETTAAPVQPG